MKYIVLRGGYSPVDIDISRRILYACASHFSCHLPLPQSASISHCLVGTCALGSDVWPTLSIAAWRAPDSPYWVLTPSILWVELMFLTRVIWKQVAPPWREVMVE